MAIIQDIRREQNQGARVAGSFRDGRLIDVSPALSRSNVVDVADRHAVVVGNGVQSFPVFAALANCLHIFCGQLSSMALFAKRLPLKLTSASPFVHHVARIIDSSAEKKVIRTAASPVVAIVQDAQPLRDRTTEVPPGKPMCAVVTERTIPGITVERSCVIPALARFIKTRQKYLDWIAVVMALPGTVAGAKTIIAAVWIEDDATVLAGSGILPAHDLNLLAVRGVSCRGSGGTLASASLYPIIA